MKRTVSTLTLISGFLFFLLLAASMPSLKAASETPQKEWEKTYGAIGSITFVVEIEDGSFFYAGSNNTDILEARWLAEADQNGTIQWSREYADWNSSIRCFAKTIDGGYIHAGAFAPNSSTWLAYALKTDLMGNVQWNRTYEKGIGSGFGFAVESAEGGYLFSGTYRHVVYPSLGPSYDVYSGWLVKTDWNGNIEWEETYDGLGESGISSLLQASDGGYVFTGRTSYANDYETQIWLVKTGATADVTPPLVSVLSPANNSRTGSDVDLTFAVSEATWMGYSLDGGETGTIAGNTTLSGLAGGVDSITVYAEDAAGNRGASETVYFTPEPFPTLLITIVAISLVVVGVGLIVYFRKRKNKAEIPAA